MNDTLIITTYVVIADLMHHLDHHDHPLTQVSDAEVLTVAVVSAKYFHNNHERALGILQQLGYLSGHLSTSRFNRRLHALADWLVLAIETLGELCATGRAFIIDSMPLPVCRRVRARRCRKVRGRDYCGYCAAKKEKFFGWRLHLICTPAGIPLTLTIMPGGYHDLTPLHELSVQAPADASIFGDKGYNCAADEQSILEETGVRVVPVRKANMTPHEWADEYDLRQMRHTIETVNSQLEKMGTQHLHARTNAGFEIKVHASVMALTITNLN